MFKSSGAVFLMLETLVLVENRNKIGLILETNDCGENIMTEKEKMQRQMLYDANYDKELLAERVRAKELCYDFNLSLIHI